MLIAIGQAAQLQIFEHRHARENVTAFGNQRDAASDDLIGWQILKYPHPSKITLPSGAFGWAQIVIIKVVLPAPLAPINATISPLPTSRLTPRRASMTPLPSLDVFEF